MEVLRLFWGVELPLHKPYIQLTWASTSIRVLYLKSLVISSYLAKIKKERTQPIHQLFQKQRNINLVDPTTTQHQWAKQTHPGNSFSNAWFILKMAIYIYIYIWKLTILLTFGHSFHLHECGSKIQPGVKDSKKEKKMLPCPILSIHSQTTPKKIAESVS